MIFILFFYALVMRRIQYELKRKIWSLKFSVFNKKSISSFLFSSLNRKHISFLVAASKLGVLEMHSAYFSGTLMKVVFNPELVINMLFQK